MNFFFFFFFFCPDGITPNSGLTGPNNTIYIYICVYHQVTLKARISLTLSSYSSLSSIALCPVYKAVVAVLAGRTTLAHPCEGVHRRMILISSSLLLQRCPAYILRLIWMVLEIGGKCPYNCCFVGCCFQDDIYINIYIYIYNYWRDKSVTLSFV